MLIFCKWFFRKVTSTNNSGKLISHWTRTHMNIFRSRKDMFISNSSGPSLNTTLPNWTQCYWFFLITCAWPEKKKSLYGKFIDSSKERSRVCGTVQSHLPVDLLHLLAAPACLNQCCSEAPIQLSCLTWCFQCQVHGVPKHLVQMCVVLQVVYMLTLTTTFEKQ